MSSATCGFAHGLHLVTDTRRLETNPGFLLGRPSYESLGAKGFLSGTLSGEQGPTAKTLFGPVQFREIFCFRTALSGFFSMAY